MRSAPRSSSSRAVVSRARVALVYGKTAPKLALAIQQAAAAAPDLPAPLLLELPDLSTALQQVATLAQPGDVVLLSPGGTSYDMYADFEERGRDFARAVGGLDA